MQNSIRIAELLEQGEKDGDDPLVIVPRPVLESLRGSVACSVDLRLGTWFVVLRQARLTHLDVGEKPTALQFSKTHYVPFGTPFILHPRNFVLGITLEWLRLPKEYGAYVIGKSSWGRRGLIIATATGVHPGFAGCLTLELTNVGQIPIAIKPGVTICQLCIHRVEGPKLGVDQSQFVGLRRPIVGNINLDEIAQKLANAYSE